MNNNSPLVSA